MSSSKADVFFVRNGSTVNVQVINVSGYDQDVIYVLIEQVKNSEIFLN